MFCRKCGSKLTDGVRFCAVCGCEVKIQTNGTMDPGTQAVNSAPEQNPPVKKKTWLIWICVILGALIIAVGVFLAVVLLKSGNQDEQPQNTIENQQDEDENQEGLASADEDSAEDNQTDTEAGTYPHTLEVDTATRQGLENMVKALSRTNIPEMWGTGKEDEICYQFFASSLEFEDEIRAGYPEVGMEDYFQSFPMGVAEKFLTDSIGICSTYILTSTVVTDELQAYVCYRDGVIYGVLPDSGELMIDSVAVEEVNAISSTQIQVIGSVYTSIPYETSTITYSLTMEKSPDSIWGGYRLLAINNWHVKDTPIVIDQPSADEYLLPEIATRYYTEIELSVLTDEELRLARNEIFARHGYIFQSQEMQDYFLAKSWYQPTVAEVTDSMLNEYELANRTLILQVEDQRVPVE